jgi:hypothetical protein
MLVREIVARHLPEGGRLAVTADGSAAGDLWRVVGQEERTGEGPADLLLLDVGDGLGTADLVAAAEPAPVLVLLLTCPLDALPLGRLSDLGRSQGLAYADAVPVTGSRRYTAAVVAGRDAARNTAALRGYLAGTELDGDDPAVAARLRWEWGVGSLAARATEVTLQADLASVRSDLADREAELGDTRRQLEQAEKRLAALEQSTALRLGRDLVALRRSPFGGTRRLLSDVRNARRRRTAR